MKKKLKSSSRRHFLGASGVLAGTYFLAGKDAFGLSDNEIVSAKIHPAIGIARVGNSDSEFYIGPEVTEPVVTEFGNMRDAKGAIKRQAARFRVYGYNAKGEVVRELTSDEAQIHWEVELSSKKGSWYRFSAALDIPEAKSNGLSLPKRNISVKNRKILEITPGSREISGVNISGIPYQFTGGKFMGISVNLGELRTDENGRLLVLGGKGRAGSPDPKKYPVFNNDDWDTFNNADGWYDDISDGPVTARVILNGKSLEVAPAWVAVAPPNYAPDIISWRTLYDLLVDNYIQAIREGKDPFPGDQNPVTKDVIRQLQRTSFTKDVLPALKRLTNLQWVNKGFSDQYGGGSSFNFEDPELLAQLSSRGRGANRELRQSIYRSFRTPERNNRDPRLWPMIYGDAFGSFEDSERESLPVSDIRSLHLKRWASGDFINDWHEDQGDFTPRRLSEVPIKEQPAILDKAALHFCLADAYHPGCELTWPMRHLTMYSEPFRILHRQGDEMNLGEQLNSINVMTVNGPLYAQGAGDLSRWMAVPWQGDTIFCRSGYEREFDPFLPTYWPARVPNHVLSEEDYLIVMGKDLPREKRLEAFHRRQHWVRAIDQRQRAPEQIEDMVKNFANMGVVEARPGVKGDPVIPSVLFVESLPKAFKVTLETEMDNLGTSRNPKGGPPRPFMNLSTDADDPLNQAGWASEEVYESFVQIKLKKKKKD